MLIYDQLFAYAEKNPDQIALIYGEEKIRYKNLSLQIKKAAVKLSEKFKPKTKLIIKAVNPLKTLIYFYAAAAAKLISILIEPDLSEKEEKEIIQKIKPEAIIKSSLPFLDNNPQFKLETANIDSEILKAKKEDLFLGALSSGSTGDFKLIWRDHQSWTAAFDSQKKIFSLTEESRLLITGSIVYTGNLNNIVQLLAAGGQIIFADSIFPKKWLKLIQKNQINSLFMVPAHYRILLKNISQKINSIKTIITAGSKIDLDSLKKLKHYFPQARICEFYGASELGHVTYAYFDELLQNKGTVGRAFPQVEINIKDNEIWVKSPYLAVDYRPEASANDLGYFKGPYLYLNGRKDNIINRGGLKVNPYKIESKLNNYEKITQAAVITAPDFLKDNLLVALVVKAEADLKLNEVYNYCRKNLKNDYLPDKIIFVEKLSKTKSGKLDRKKLSKILSDKLKK